MVEDNKLYNGHTYSGVQLIACLNGYIQGRKDKYQAIVSEYMLLTEEQVKAIIAETIDECVKTLAESEDTILSDKQYYALMELKEQL